MIKKIRLWKMIGLFIVTLGIYGLGWLVARRNEIVEHYKLPVPHWIWLVAPPIASFAILLPGAYISYGFTTQVSSTFSVLYGILLLGLLVAYAISLWWMYRFGRAAQLITEGKMPLVWTMINTIFLGPIGLFMLQYYFNRISKTVNVKTKPQYRPTKNFVILSVTLLIISAPFTIMSLVQLPNTLREGSLLQVEGNKIDELLNQADALRDEHTTCVNKLEADYPGDITVEEEPAYTKAYDACEEIRIKQHDKVDEYNKALEKW